MIEEKQAEWNESMEAESEAMTIVWNTLRYAHKIYLTLIHFLRFLNFLN